MTPENERAAFEKNIDDNPLEASNHLVYADWLREHGHHDEGDFREAMGDWVNSNRQNITSAKNGISPVGRYKVHPLNLPKGVHPRHLDYSTVGWLLHPRRDAALLTGDNLIAYRNWRHMENQFRRSFLASRATKMSRIDRDRIKARRYMRGK